MIIALGEIQTKSLIQDLISIAKGENELHEKNPQYGMYTHSDGWGLAYLNNKDKWEIYKSTKSIYEDESVTQFENLRSKCVILHVRRATKGKISLENTQPLIYANNNMQYVFAHNGTIADSLQIESKYLQMGDSDSVMWFNKIIDELNKEHTNYYSFKNFSSANFFLVTPKKIIVGQRYKRYPNYSTMKVYKDSEKIIISSEILPTLKEKRWIKLQNEVLVEIDLLNK